MVSISRTVARYSDIPKLSRIYTSLLDVCNGIALAIANKHSIILDLIEGPNDATA